MNVYDFDKTIYAGDSTVHFYFYSIKRHPRILLRLPALLWYEILFMLRVYTKTQFKERFYRFLKDIPDVDTVVEDFWETHEKNVKGFHKQGGLVISASPEFLLAPICKKLGMSLIASRVDKHTGKYTGKNCHGREKVCRFKEVYADTEINEFYSDSLSDSPLAKLAKTAFLVKKEDIIPWSEAKPSSFKSTFLSRQFLTFVIIGVINTALCTVFSCIYSIFAEENLSFVLGYATSLIISYLLNSFITFKSVLSWEKFIKFCISYIPNFIIQQTVVTLCLEVIGIHKLIAYVLAAVIGVPVTFVIMKIFAFKRRKSNEKL